MGDLISRKELMVAMEKKYVIAKETGMYPSELEEAFIITEQIIKEHPSPFGMGDMLERRVPKDVGAIELDGRNVVYCPECGYEEFLTNNEGTHNEYCGSCGQRLKWEG